MYMIMDNSGVREMPGADSMRSILGFGMVIVAIFAFIFLFYTNSFLIKQRRKEIGLYNVLGMGKKELSIMMFWESLTTGGISIVIGLIGGAIFGKLMFLCFIRSSDTRRLYSTRFPLAASAQPCSSLWRLHLSPSHSTCCR